jgi:hypothetical protein
MLDPSYLAAAFVVSSIGFVMFMYGKRQHRPVQLASGLLLLLLPFLVRDGLLLSVAAAIVCAAVWGSVKAGL